MKGAFFALLCIVGMLGGVSGAYFFTAKVLVTPPKQSRLPVGEISLLRGYITQVDPQAQMMQLHSPSRYRAGETDVFALRFATTTMLLGQASAAGGDKAVEIAKHTADRLVIVQLADSLPGRIEAKIITILPENK